jgi:aerobic-type carbon monoxide dehydrogenase small subunit (CoxS/CutS family)
MDLVNQRSVGGGQQEAHFLVHGRDAASTTGRSFRREIGQRAGRHRVRHRNGERNRRTTTWTKGDVGLRTKKGCDHGQCGACTVMVNGRRINSCLTLAVMHEGDNVTTIEGLGSPANLHPMQAAFIKHDGYQCGYCTPGQICSSVAMLKEIEADVPSLATDDLTTPTVASLAEFRERMSGNICRCGAYSNIMEAITEVAERKA